MTDVPERRVSGKSCTIAFAVLVGVAVAVFLFFWYSCNPPSRVEVTIRNIPAHTTRVGLIVDADGTLDWMEGWQGAIFGPIKAGLSVWKLDRPFDAARDFGPVQVTWKKGTRFGIIMQDDRKEWRVAWFDRAQAPITNRDPLGGGGVVTLDLRQARVEALRPNQIETLGLPID